MTFASNGGMMCYRLAAELSHRIAAIAPVSGTVAVQECRPRRPVSVMHFHGTEDKLVPFRGPDERTAKPLAFKSVEETIRIWTKLDGCPTTPKTIALPDKEGKGRRLTPNSCRRPQIWPCNSGPKDVVRGDRTG